jgi:NADH-quinone oxidoreductase subunit C
MDTSELIPKLERAVPGAVMEMRPFGRGGDVSLWVEMKSVARVARFLRDDPGLGLDWLENLNVMEMDGTLVLTYFARSSRGGESALVLRGTVVPASADAEVDVPSVADVWPSASAFEQEAWDLFGVRFAKDLPRRLVPADWNGFPLRKGYAFPSEYAGVPHMRRGSPEKIDGGSA